MRPVALPQAALLGGLLAVALVPAVTAQGRGRAKPAPEAPATLGADSLNNLKFRNLGPSGGGGRVTAVAGIPGEPNISYVGAAAGGGWKTTDGGDPWGAGLKGHPTCSIRAL